IVDGDRHPQLLAGVLVQERVVALRHRQLAQHPVVEAGLLDCVMRTDGAAGLLMMSRKRAKEKGLSKCIIPIGYAERTNFKGGENLVDVTKSGHELCGKKALAAAGLGIKDIASFHPYDDFIIAIMLQLEAFGFCKAGQGVQYIRDHDFSYNGDLPLNTGGGQISAGQAACSSHNLVEAVRQLRGEGGKRQVKDTRNALVTGIGWINYGRNWASSAPSSTSIFLSRIGRRRSRRSSSSSIARRPASTSTSLVR